MHRIQPHKTAFVSPSTTTSKQTTMAPSDSAPSNSRSSFTQLCIQYLTSKEPVPILDIPAEIEHLIFERLDRVSSACLGLTCKRFYKTHFSLNPRVKLIAFCPLPPDVDSGFHLYEMLGEWMGPDMWFDIWGLRYCRKSRAENELLRKRDRAKNELLEMSTREFYPSQLKFTKHEKDGTDMDEGMQKWKLQNLEIDKDDKCYVYNVNIWRRRNELRHNEWLRLKIRFNEVLNRARDLGRREFGGYWTQGGWVDDLSLR
jgi:hypothetical protein